MPSLSRPGLSLLPLLAALLLSACKTAEKAETDVAPSAAPPAASAAADPPAATTAAPAVPVHAAPPPATAKPDAGAITDAGVITDAGATTDAGKVADAGTAANGTLKACSEKCQALLQGCALPPIPKDGGLPVLKDPVACQAAAAACFAACTP